MARYIDAEKEGRITMNSGCNQLCPYNTLEGCKVNQYSGVCPISNVKPLEKIEQLPTLVKTGDRLGRCRKMYEVVIADDNIFVVCPLKYSGKEKSMIVKYSRPEIYANQREINTLRELGFVRCL